MPLMRVGHRDDWPTLGWQVIDWVEAYLPHGPGDVQGEPFILDLEEVQLFLDLYRVYPRGMEREGRRVVSRGVWSRGKGRRKSELAGAVVCAEALGPVRFGGWDAQGEPVGRPVQSPFIRCLATEEQQSGNTYQNVAFMLDHAGRKHPDVFRGLDLGRRPQGSTRIFLPGGGEIRPSTASSAGKDGGKETHAVADEPHLYVLPELREMHRVVSRNLMKRPAAEPWMLETTTGFRPGQLSVAEGAMRTAEAVAEGRARVAGFYMNHREGPEVADWGDDGQVLVALKEAYGDAAEWMDLGRILAEEIRNPDAKEHDSRRYWLNQSRKAGQTAFDLARWKALEDLEREIPADELVTLGFDGARFEDSTGLVATHVQSGHQMVLGVWEKPFDAGDDWEIDETEVDGTVDEAFDRFDVWRLYADPPYWEASVNRWAGRHGEKRVVRWYTHRSRPMAHAVRAYDTAIQAGNLSHDGDEAMVRHVGNCYRRDLVRIRDEKGRVMWTVQKEHPQSPRKIDLVMAGILSWEARGDAVASGARRRSNRAVFV